MNTRLDTRVHDGEVLDEIELYGELIIAASDSEGPLSEAQIDTILGIKHDDAAVLADVAAGSGRPAHVVRGVHTAPAALRRRSAS